MGSHSHAHSLDNELTQLKPGSRVLGIGLMALGVAAFAGAFGASLATEQHSQRFFWALLFGTIGFLAISCSALIFVLINHLVRAGWITNVRRILEVMSMQIPLMGLLLLPIIFVTATSSTVDHNGHKTPWVYSWAVPSDTPVVHHGQAPDAGPDDHPAPHPAPLAGPHAADDRDPAAGEKHEVSPSALSPGPKGHDDSLVNGIAYPNEQVQPGIQRHYDEIIKEKRDNWLKPMFWGVRIIAYFLILSAVGWWYWSRSVKQDASGDIDISSRLQQASGPILMACGLIVTFIAFDMFMSLDPHWFSTMYGVYFFASGSQAMWAVMILICLGLQSRGYLTSSVSKEHYHDMGKFMFTFVVFFAYIAFSQYMLQWYANMPEETFWYDKRGYSTAHPNGYTPLVLILLIGRFVIPFLGVISRHVKRNMFGIGFWAIWLIACFFVDMYLLTMPEFHWAETPGQMLFGLPEILCLLGAGSIWLGNIIRMLASHALRPVQDPRTHESMALQNF